MSEKEKEVIRGTVERISFHNSENGFTVLEIMGDGQIITAVGIISDIAEGEGIEATGCWDSHTKYGQQFKIESYERTLPETADEIYKYLASGVIKGIGPSTAEKIVNMFGARTFEVMENEPDELARIKGISKDKAEQISKVFKEQHAIREIMIELSRYSMTTQEIIKAYKAYGERAVQIIEENPYELCETVSGISFDRAEAIAERLPNPPSSHYRIRAGILYVIEHNLSNGHTCIPRDRLLKPCADMLETNEDTIDIMIDELAQQHMLVREEFSGREFLYLPQMHEAEGSSAVRLKVMTEYPPFGCGPDICAVEKVEKALGIEYEENRRRAIKSAQEKGLLILTGGPGTGKTTTIRGIMQLYEDNGVKVVLAAPTGRAAKRMTEVTGKEAVTIHRLLEAEFDENDKVCFRRNKKNMLETDALIVDELSMVDAKLFASLIEAVPLGARLIMVGDSNQLPAVGAGNVLQDMILADAVPVVQLKEVFRQAMESLIVKNAHLIVEGEKPILNVVNNDFFFMKTRSGIEVTRTVAQLCATRLPNAYNYDPYRDIQVICPMRIGETGSVNMNKILQNVLNPADDFKIEARIGNKLFREGDKVMQTKNNYDIVWIRDDEESQGIYNGDIGVIREIDDRSQEIIVEFDDKTAVYGYEGADELELAYAVTVHKSQGNEFEAVIMPVWGVPEPLMYRNLLYTGVTRAKNKIILVGNEAEIYRMVENDKKTKRFTGFYEMLKGGK
ncbi:MAG: ATP-dependent RecD-like DNA helicase [Clostridia bacterium]|nr:ATP-dependent RecD-like DNA helicase [Clostridia bacterium]